jgi:hypothetical protein
MGRRSGTLADDGGALVEVGGAILEDGGVVGGAATLGGKFWHHVGVVSFRTKTWKIFRAQLVYIKGSNTGGPHYTTASGEIITGGRLKRPLVVRIPAGGYH